MCRTQCSSSAASRCVSQHMPAELPGLTVSVGSSNTALSTACVLDRASQERSEAASNENMRTANDVELRQTKTEKSKEDEGLNDARLCQQRTSFNGVCALPYRVQLVSRPASR